MDAEKARPENRLQTEPSILGNTQRDDARKETAPGGGSSGTSGLASASSKRRERIRQLEARLERERSRESEASRKERNGQLFVWGAMVEGVYRNGEEQECGLMCIHAPARKGDNRNHHAHFLTTTRRITNGRLGEKTRMLDSPKTSGQEVNAVREIWERLCNAALMLVGVEERVDRRTLKAQGIQREPTRHLGPTASAMERRGVRSFRGDINRRASSNSVAAEIEHELAELKKLEGGIEGARERFAERKAEKARQEREAA